MTRMALMGDRGSWRDKKGSRFSCRVPAYLPVPIYEPAHLLRSAASLSTYLLRRYFTHHTFIHP